MTEKKTTTEKKMTIEQRLDAQAKAIRDLRARVATLEGKTGAVTGTERVLTGAARRRLASGAKKGAGTDVCATCSKAKEKSRLNSNRCKSCDRGPDIRDSDKESSL